MAWLLLFCSIDMRLNEKIEVKKLSLIELLQRVTVPPKENRSPPPRLGERCALRDPIEILCELSKETDQSSTCGVVT
jgi:hypothetical protein